MPDGDKDKYSNQYQKQPWRENNSSRNNYRGGSYSRGHGGGGSNMRGGYGSKTYRHHYDPEKTSKYNEYIDFRKAMADTEENFL